MKNLFFLLSALVIASTASATSLELSGFGADVLESFMSNISQMKFVSTLAGAPIPQGTVLKAFSKALAAASSVSANCTYRAKTTIEDCYVNVQEGTEGEGRGKMESFGFHRVQGSAFPEVTHIIAL